MNEPLPTSQQTRAGLLSRLARDSGGNVLMIVAASLFPLLALIGSGVDMGRAYLAETRLQQACDAGTLAARKRLGSQVVVNGNIPDNVGETGQRFFNINFRDGAYTTENRAFAMTMEDNYAISGEASADVPTTIMGAFGYDNIPIAVTCSAQLNMPNTDIMMVLDTTGSMMWVNPGDTVTRIDALRSTVRSFYAQMEASKGAGTRIRYGFVPYSTNVNVGGLLQPDWLVDEWNYNSRVAHQTGQTTTQNVTEGRYVYISGSTSNGSTYVSGSCPANAVNTQNLGTSITADGWTRTEYLQNGTGYSCTQVDTGSYSITPRTYNQHRYYWDTRITGTIQVPVSDWQYRSETVDLSFLSGSNMTTRPIGGSPSNPQNVNVYYRGCIEERSTYEIADYNNVDLNRAIDLDIDRVPDANDPDTQWRPMLNELSFIREIRTNGQGAFSPGQVNSSFDFINAWWWGFGACPSPARRLAEMTSAQLDTYLNSLVAQGSTYHDIGMIWGGRLLSPTGIFAADNADVGSSATQRHMIFLTDGETAPLDVSYGSYGIEPLERRRWRPQSSMSLTQTVENRFSFACEEVKKRNIQVWVISFGTGANPIMQNCAGPDRYYVASDAAELEQTFSDIARRMGELRLVD